MTLDVERLLADLTVEEKAALTSGGGFWTTAAVERLGIPAITVSDGPHGLRVQPGAGGHVGLGGSLPATCFPTASATASTWDLDLLRRMGVALADEARACGLSVILGPGINIKRSPLCGRNFEYFSEDPYLTGELAAALVRGIQSREVGTSVKHFAANNQETDRLRVDTQVSERALREIYLPAFERVITGERPWTVMAAYNKINGVSATQNHWLLTTVLREEWGYDGVVVSDWGAVYDRVPALLAGTDLEMPPAPRSPGEVVAAVESGELDEAVLDERVRTVLSLVARGMAIQTLDEQFDADAHHALAREIAAASAVLLRNDTGLLPLTADADVALIGEFARTPRFQGAGSSQVVPTQVTTLLHALGEQHPRLSFAPGYRIDEDTADEELVVEAVAAAAAADVVVLLLGLPAAAESEGVDRVRLDLPDNQLRLLGAVAAANPHLIVGLVNGAVVDVRPVMDVAPAIVEFWLGGQAAGEAIADVLTGAAEPGGRLAETAPLRLEDNPSYLTFPGDSQVTRYGEDIFVGYRGYDAAERAVAFPFGHGLSYTTFTLHDAEATLTGSVVEGDLAADVSVTVHNEGLRAGSHVVQAYVRDPQSSVRRPVRELGGFAKVFLQPGESRTVSIRVAQRAFSFWSELLGRWVVEAGEFVLEIGNSSRDLPFQIPLTVDAPAVTAPLTQSSTLAEWLADPIGRALLVAAAAAVGAAEVLDDDALITVVGSMPMRTLSDFGFFSAEDLDAAVMEYAHGNRDDRTDVRYARGMSAFAPPGWPRSVRPPDAPDWERTAVNWLFDISPPEFRSYPALRRHILVLARFAALHVEAGQAAVRRGLSEARADLRDLADHAVIDAALDCFHAEDARLLALRREVALVEEALRGRRYVARL